MTLKQSTSSKIASFLHKTLLFTALAFVPAVTTTIVTGTALAVSTSPALAAITLESAKQQGLVGERPDGLLGIVGHKVNAEAKDLVEDVNARRMEIFKKIAKEKNQPVEAVQKISGEEFISRTPKGQYVMNKQGEWIKK